jgi:tripartite-type tricarboxylate transporter receptor subunit TctC
MKAVRCLAVCAVTAWPLVHAPVVCADSYPNKPIRITNMYAPGGGVDVVARVLGQKLTEKLGQPVIVESRPGAGGTIAAATVAKQPADGYNLLITDVSFSISAVVYKDLTYDAGKDFTPIILLNTVSQALVVNPSVPVKTVPELVAYAKANPDKLMYASAGVGTPNHLAVEILKSQAGINLTHVPYKGAVPALTDVVAGRVHVYIGALASILPHLQSGALRALAVMDTQRSDLVQDLPTVMEAGLKDFNMGAWYGILGPAGMPAPVVAKLNQELNEAIKSEESRRTMRTLGTVAKGGTPQEFAVFLREDLAKWKKAAEIVANESK